MSTTLAGRRLAVLIGLLPLAGCGGEMKVAPVAGTVTLDGQPLDRASVLFQPDQGGRPSYGVTDKNGRYTLLYSMNENGAEVGSATVKITTRLQSDDSSGDVRDDGPRAPERVPKRYEKEPVKVTVEPRSNTIDIVLTSK